MSITQRHPEDYVAIDLETSDLKGTTIWCCGFAFHDITYVLEWGEAKAKLLELLNDSDYTFVLQNPAFDVWVLRKHGIDIPAGRYVDTMMGAHCINPQRKLYGLDSLLADIGEHKIDYGQALIDAGMWHGKKDDPAIYEIPFNEVMDRYCAQDTYGTLMLWYSQQPHFARDERMRSSYETIHLPMIEVTISLHGGMHIDYLSTLALASELVGEIDRDTTEFIKLVGAVPKLKWNKDAQEYDVVRNRDGTVKRIIPNLNSPNDIHSLLFVNGWKPDDFKRSTGKPISDQANLRRLIATPDVDARLVQVASALVELKSKIGIQNQLLQLLKLAEMDTGMLYGNWLQHGTMTKRYSSSAP